MSAGPPSTAGVRKKASPIMNAMSMLDSSPALVRGRNTRAKARNQVAPRLLADVTSSPSIPAIVPYSIRIMNGSRYAIMPMTVPQCV